MNTNQLDLLNRKLSEILAPTKVTILSSNRIRIGNSEFEFYSNSDGKEISSRTVTSR